jgi:hypothetical protein
MWTGRRRLQEHSTQVSESARRVIITTTALSSQRTFACEGRPGTYRGSVPFPEIASPTGLDLEAVVLPLIKKRKSDDRLFCHKQPRGGSKAKDGRTAEIPATKIDGRPLGSASERRCRGEGGGREVQGLQKSLLAGYK